MTVQPGEDERIRFPAVLAGLALLLASAALALLVGHLVQSGRVGETARMIAERGTVEAQLGHARDGGVTDAGPSLPALAGPSLHLATSTEDPQLEASRRSFQRHGDAGVPSPFVETWARGHLVQAEGVPAVHTGDECWVRVLPVAGGGYNCLVRVMCGDTLLYPDGPQQAGYAPCEVEGGRVTTGHDGSSSGRDGDPTLDFDLRGRSVRVTDAAPEEGEPYYEQTAGSAVHDFTAQIALDPPRA
jgi:hypothetical protein